MARAVTEQDLRRPEFRDGTPEDYEFDRKGKIVPRANKGASMIDSLLKRAESHLTTLEAQQAQSYATELDVTQWNRTSSAVETIASLRALRRAGVKRFNVQLKDGTLVNGVKLRGLALIARQGGRAVLVDAASVTRWTPAAAKPWYYFGL